MPRPVRGPDGQLYTFPADATDEEVLRFFEAREAAAANQRQVTGQAARAAGERRGRRSAWERFTDVARDTWETSAPGQLNRRADPNANGLDAGDLWQAPQIREGGLIDRALDATMGTDRSYLRGTDTTTEADRQERARRAEFARQSADDSFMDQETIGGRVAHGGAALMGVLTAAAADPVSWVNPGRTLLTRAASQAGIAGAVDAGLQVDDLQTGVADDYSVARTALSAAAGGSFSALSDLAGAGTRAIQDRVLRQPEAAAAPELEVGDELLTPAMSLREIEPTAPILRPVNDNADLSGVEPAPVTLPDATTPPLARSPDQGQGWDDVDWGAQRSRERADAALQHLDGLRQWIKPGHVTAFMRTLNDATPEGGVSLDDRWIDWEKMADDPEGILRFTDAMGSIFDDVYREAGRGNQGWATTAQVARQMGYSVADVIKTHADITGEGGLAARTGALRDAAAASDRAFFEQLSGFRTALAKGDKTGLPGLVDSLHRTITLSAMDAGATSEIARALQYRKSRQQVPRRDLQAAMTELGGIMGKGKDLSDADLDRLLEALTSSYEKGGSVGLRQSIRQMRDMGFWDYVGYYSTASLLAAPTTHIRNAFGTPLHALFQIGERYAAAGIGAARQAAGLGSKERVTFREAVAYTSGTVQTWGEALAAAGAAFKRGAPVSDQRSSVMSDEMAMQVPFQLNADRLAKWRRQGLTLTTAADAIGVAVFEVQRTLGFRFSVAADEFYKALGRRMQLNALAYREAAYRAAVAGPEDADAVFAATLRALQEEPTEAAFRAAREFFEGDQRGAQAVHAVGSHDEEMALILRSIDHRQMAVDHAQLLAFQDSGPVVDKLDAALRAVPIVKHMWVNFVRTPINLLRAGMVMRNPVIGGAVALGELTTHSGREKHQALFRALADEQAALERGGAEADLVIARQVIGAAVLSTFWMLWAGGAIVGKRNPEERREGVEDYSFRLPDGSWMRYDGMSPIAEMMGLVADVAQSIRDHDLEEEGAAAIMGALAAAVRNNIVNKSFLKGVGDFMEMMTGGSYGAPSDQSGGEAMARQLSEAVVPRIIPGGALLRRVAQDQDPVIRDARSFTDMILAGVPTMTESIAARRDFMGRPLIRQPGQRGPFQAFNVSRPSEDPLERELASLARQDATFSIGNTPRGSLSPEDYSRLLEVQGQLYRDPRTGRNMEETLRDLVQQPDYLADHLPSRTYRVRQVISRFREAGRRAAADARSSHHIPAVRHQQQVRRLEGVARRQRLSQSELMERALRFEVDPNDPEVRRLRRALYPNG